MSFTKKLFSRKFFLVNLVLIGIMLGFTAAFLAFAGFGNRNGSSPAEVKAETLPEPGTAVTQAIQTAEALQLAFNYVANTVRPSVVELQVVSESSIGGSNGNELPWRFFFGDPEEGEGNGPQVQPSEGLGSGIIVRKSGRTVYVLTNTHVVEGATKITIRLFDEEDFEGTLLGTDERRDLAVVSFQTNRTDIRVASLGDSEKLKVGDWAIAIGSPFGLFSSVTTGIVSALGRDGGPDGNISDFIQTDAAINRGNSGGALVNIRGEVVGINTWIASPTGGSIGLGFSIPINNAKRTIDDIISDGSVKYGWLGVLLQTADRNTLGSLGLQEQARGSMIGSIFSSGPAAKSGLQAGDFVTAIDGRTVSSTEQLIRMVGDLPAGTDALFSIMRDGKAREIKVRIEERKTPDAQDYSGLWPGMEVSAITDLVRSQLKLDRSVSGVVVSSIIPRTPVVTLSLRAGDIITAVNEKNVRNLQDFYRLLNDQSMASLQFTILREGQTLTTLALVRK
ncbi:MAG: Do family serine endopeptidase [Spirochaetes bacterium]|nr:Do family serine endopeptidase [Spirochaetota bacterium]